MEDNIVKSLYIEQYKGFKNFKIELNDKLTVLVGANGTGKTSILEVIFNILVGKDEQFKIVNNFKSAELEIMNGKKIKFILENNEVKKYIDNIQVDNDNEFFKKQKVLYFPSEVSFKNYEMTGPNKLEIASRDVILNADKMSKDLKQFLINQKYQDLNDIAEGNIESANRIERFKKIYNNFLSDKKFIGVDNDTFEPLFELNDTKEKIPIDNLSSGEKQIFFKGGSLLQYGENKKITVLIDEPEISLYPEWQQKILKFYTSINPNAQFIFATHSPHIVACCNKEELRVLGKNENGIFINDNIKETYGLTNEEILFDIFDLDSVRNLDVQKDLNDYRNLFYKRKFLKKEEPKEHLKYEAYLLTPLDDRGLITIEIFDINNTERIENKLKGYETINSRMQFIKSNLDKIDLKNKNSEVNKLIKEMIEFTIGEVEPWFENGFEYCSMYRDNFENDINDLKKILKKL